MQRKTEKLSLNASKLGINVNIPKATVLKVNVKVNSPVSLGGEDIELVEELCYLGKLSSAQMVEQIRMLVLGSARLGMHLGPYNQCGSQDGSL